jgi:toxin HigB-1
MIRSCRDKETEKVLHRVLSRKFQAIQDRAEERLAQLNAAASLQDLSIPSMRLEKLSGDREGQYSIASTINTGLASNGGTGMSTRLKLSTTIKGEGP